MKVLIGSMENRVCVCAASLVGKERSKETKWSNERVEIAASVVGRTREVCSQYVAKVMFAAGGNKLWSHREFVFLVVSGRSVDVSRKYCPEVK